MQRFRWNARADRVEVESCQSVRVIMAAALDASASAEALRDLMTLGLDDEIDWRTWRIGDARAVERVLGIEAARRAVREELWFLLSSGVAPRHMTLVADAMTQTGVLLPLNQNGRDRMPGADVCALGRACFNAPAKKLQLAARAGHRDNLMSADSRQLVGMAPAVGTSPEMFTIVSSAGTETVAPPTAPTVVPTVDTTLVALARPAGGPSSGGLSAALSGGGTPSRTPSINAALRAMFASSLRVSTVASGGQSFLRDAFRRHTSGPLAPSPHERHPTRHMSFVPSSPRTLVRTTAGALGGYAAASCGNLHGTWDKDDPLDGRLGGRKRPSEDVGGGGGGGGGDMGSPYKRLSSGGELTPRIPGNLRHSTSYSGGGVTGQLSLQMAAAAAVAATDSSSYIPHSRSYGHFGGGVLAGSGIGGRASGGGGGHLPYGRSATWAAGPPSPQFSPSSCAHSLSGNWVVSSPTTGRPPSHLLGDGNDVFHLSGEHTPLGTSPLPPPPSYTEVMRQSHVYALNRTSVGIPEDSAVTDNSPPRDPRRNPRVLQAAPPTFSRPPFIPYDPEMPHAGDDDDAMQRPIIPYDPERPHAGDDDAMQLPPIPYDPEAPFAGTDAGPSRPPQQPPVLPPHFIFPYGLQLQLERFSAEAGDRATQRLTG